MTLSKQWHSRAEHAKLLQCDPFYREAEMMLREFSCTVMGVPVERLLRVECFTRKNHPETWIVARCPFCGERHEHSAGEGMRQVHCVDTDGRPPEHLDYYLFLGDENNPREGRLYPPKYRFPVPSSKKEKARRSVTMRTRLLVLKRDGYRCRLCGRGVEDGVKLEAGHIVASSKDGSDAPDNLLTMCFDCNHGMLTDEP